MKFTIHKKTLVKMLKVLSGGWVKKDALSSPPPSCPHRMSHSAHSGVRLR
jgi:hypothetical protein